MSLNSDKVDSDLTDGPYSSSSDSSYSFEQKLSGSKSALSDLEAMGVSYDENPTDLDEIFRRLKLYRVGMNPILKMFKTILKDTLPFCLDSLTEMLDKASRDVVHPLLHQKLVKIDLCTRDFWAYKRNLKSDGEKLTRIQEENGLQLSNEELSLFDDLLDVWIGKAFEFLVSVRDLCTTVAVVAEKTVERESTRDGPHRDGYVRESCYTDTIIKYTHLFFLSPKSCDSSTKVFSIRNKHVGRVPYVRYYRHSDAGDLTEEVVCLIEVNARAMKKVDGIKLTDRLKPEVLGQIGAELLKKYSKSTFSFSGMCLALLCMGTEVTFLVLNIALDHYKAIVGNKPCDGKTATINYTKSFDIIRDTDRAEMMEFMIWLGYLQKPDLKLYYHRE